MIPVTAYQAIDGKLFPTKTAALRHERTLRLAPDIEKFQQDTLYPFDTESSTYRTISKQVVQAWEQYKAAQRPTLAFGGTAPRTLTENSRLKKQIAKKVAPWAESFVGSKLFGRTSQNQQAIGRKVVTAWEQFLSGAYVAPEPLLPSIAVRPATARKSISNLGLSVRALHPLLKADVWKVGQLLEYTPEKLGRLAGMGRVTVAEVEKTLELRGLRLGQLAGAPA